MLDTRWSAAVPSGVVDLQIHPLVSDADGF
jgi:hypothetical protein